MLEISITEATREMIFAIGVSFFSFQGVDLWLEGAWNMHWSIQFKNNKLENLLFLKSPQGYQVNDYDEKLVLIPIIDLKSIFRYNLQDKKLPPNYFH